MEYKRHAPQVFIFWSKMKERVVFEWKNGQQQQNQSREHHPASQPTPLEAISGRYWGVIKLNHADRRDRRTSHQHQTSAPLV